MKNDFGLQTDILMVSDVSETSRNDDGKVYRISCKARARTDRGWEGTIKYYVELSEYGNIWVAAEQVEGH